MTWITYAVRAKLSEARKVHKVARHIYGCLNVRLIKRAKGNYVITINPEVY